MYGVPSIGIGNFFGMMPPALLKRRGLDYERLSAINPGLIMAHFSGYGLEGPLSAGVRG